MYLSNFSVAKELILNVPAPLLSHSLQVRQARAPGAVGAPGLERDPVSQAQAVVLVKTLRLLKTPAQLVGTHFNCNISINFYKEIAYLGAPGDLAQPPLPHPALRSGAKCVRRPVLKVSLSVDLLPLITMY